MSSLRPLLLVCAALTLQGCLAKAAVDVVTLPVRAVGAGVDAATTSQSEADEKRGRAIRKHEERFAELEREYAKEMERCADGNDEACEKAARINEETEELLRNPPERR